MTMLSLPNNWEFSIKGLATLFPDGERKIASTLIDLEEKEYLVRIKKYVNGRVADWQYVVSDTKVPQDIVKQGFRYKKNAGNSTDSKKILQLQNADVENDDVDNVDIGNVDVTFADMQNSYDNQYTKRSNTKKLNIIGSITQSIKRKAADTADMMDEMNTYRNVIKSNIGYDSLIENGNAELIEELVEIITETVCTTSDTIRIGRENKPAETVKSVFLKINDSHIQYVIDNISSNKTEIKNIKAYLLTTLYNATMTMNTHYQAMASHDLSDQNEEDQESAGYYAQLAKNLRRR